MSDEQTNMMGEISVTDGTARAQESAQEVKAAPPKDAKAVEKPEPKPEAKADKEPKPEAKEFADEDADSDTEPLTKEEEDALFAAYKKGKLPPGMLKRMARMKRQAADADRLAAAARDERDEFGEKLKVLEGIVEKLKAKGTKLDPKDFESYEEFQRAKAKQAEPVEEPKPEAKAAPKADAEMIEVMGDLEEAADAADPKLWAKATKAGAEGRLWLSGAMAVEMAEMDDPAAALMALLDAGEDEAKSLAEMTARQQVRRLRQLVREAKGAEVVDLKAKADAKAEASPDRDASTGQFVKRQSNAEPPINPVGSGATGRRPLDKMSTDEFIEHRNAEASKGGRFGWGN